MLSTASLSIPTGRRVKPHDGTKFYFQEACLWFVETGMDTGHWKLEAGILQDLRITFFI